MTQIFLYTPILVLMAMGFNESELYELPFQFSTRWYSALASNTELLTSSFNSIFLAVITAVVATSIGTLAALALSRRTFNRGPFRPARLRLTRARLLASIWVSGPGMSGI